MKEDTVLKLCGRVPDESVSFIDPVGNRRWFAHLDCMNSAALKEAGKLDVTIADHADRDGRSAPPT